MKRLAKSLHSKGLKGRFLLDSNVFISYLKGDELADRAENVVKLIVDGVLEALTSFMLYDDVISGLRSKGMKLGDIIQVLTAIASIPHTPLPVTPAIAINALILYMQHGGSRKLHYFDTFHVATARFHELPMITSDTYVNEHQVNLGIRSIDLKKL